MEVRLCIGIPTHKEYCLYKFFSNYLKLIKPQYCQTYIYDDQPVSKCRNKIVQHAQEWGATHLLFLDDDMRLPENSIEVLLNHDKDIVGLLAFKRKEPFLPVIYKQDPYDADRFLTMIDYDKGLISVAATGTACMMIKMGVFKNINFPWFDFAHDPNYPGQMMSEDLYFCKRARDAGYQIWVDTNDDHSIGHLGVAEVNSTVWKQFKHHKYGDLGRAEVDRLGNILEAPIKILIE